MKVLLAELPERCPVCGRKMEKGYVSATPDIYWSEKKITWRSVRSHWEALLGGCFRGIMVSTETYRCPDCKIVLFFYRKDGE